MIAYSITYVSYIIFSDLKRMKDLNQLVLWTTQRKIIHQNVKAYHLHQQEAKAQPDTSLTLTEPKLSTSTGKRKERASTKGDMSRESRSSTSLTTSTASRKKLKIEKELLQMCVSYETDMIIYNTIKENVRDILMEVIKEFKESYDKEINDVCNSLINEMAIETLIDLLHDEKKELLIYEDFIYNFSKDILDEGMLKVETEKILHDKVDKQKGFKPCFRLHQNFIGNHPDYY